LLAHKTYFVWLLGTVTGCIGRGEDAIPHRLALLYSV